MRVFREARLRKERHCKRGGIIEENKRKTTKGKAVAKYLGPSKDILKSMEASYLYYKHTTV